MRKGFHLVTDASYKTIGAILAQEKSLAQRKMIAEYSKKLDVPQKNYSNTDKEL